MTEIFLLSGFLAIAFILAPIMARVFFLEGSKSYAIAHGLSLLLLTMGACLQIKAFAFVWPVFCLGGACLYVKTELKSLFTAKGVAGGIPFAFSLISAIWFVAGVHDFGLLSYNQMWSFYAALHGAILGWLFVGCLAYLARRPGAQAPYLACCYASLLLFLFVAFGINGVPVIKRIGVVGFSVMVPTLIAFYAFNLPRPRRAAFLLSVLSLTGILVSMTLALLNEFWHEFPRTALGLPTMVLLHGLINTVVVVPCFFFAIWLESRRTSLD